MSFRNLFGIGLVGMVTAISVSTASAAVITTTLDSSLFNNKYEGDAVPVYNNNGTTTPAYFVGSTFNSGPTSDGNILTYLTADSSNGGFFESTSNVWNVGSANGVTDANGWTIEARIKIGNDATPEAADGSFQIFGRDNGARTSSGRRTAIKIGRSKLTWSASSGSQNTLLDSSDNTDGFHVFRVAQEPGSNVGHFWRDGIELGSTSGQGYGSNESATLAAGDMFWASGSSGLFGSTIDVDYFRFDTTGAYAPVPEPSGVALAWVTLLVAGSMIGRRQNAAAASSVRGHAE